MTEPIVSGSSVVIVSSTGSPGPQGPSGVSNLSVQQTQPQGVPDHQVWVQVPSGGQAPPSVAGLSAEVDSINNALGQSPTAGRWIVTVNGLTPNATGTVWDSISGGIQIIDILRLNGAPWTNGTFTNNAQGQAIMQVTNDNDVWYLDFGGPRVRVTPMSVLPGVLQIGSSVTSVRPYPAVAGVGGQWYDLTLKKPIWSDGTAWRDSDGLAV